jgi:DNA polymerase-1
MPKRLVILDGYSLLYRAFFATRYMSTSDGRPTNALYGFVGMLFYILEHDEPDALVVALDAPGKTFRHAEYAEYKGTRRETVDELRVQLKESRDLIAALGIPALEVPGYEADDIVGSVSKLGEENGYKTTIVTGDLDSLQLVDDEVSVMTNKMGVTDVIVYKPADVVERYGFEAIYVPDYKSIVGDTSDNIPGVPGIGQKGATTLIQQFGTVENMLENWDEIDPKFQKKIEPVRDQMLKSKWLATIVRDAPVSYDFEPFTLSQEQFDAAKAFFELYELRSHVRRMPVVLGKYLHGFERGVTAPAEVHTESIEVNLKPAEGLAKLHEFVGDKPYSLYFDSAPVPAPPAEDLFTATEKKPERIAFVAIGSEVRQATEAEGMALFREKPGQLVAHDAKPLYHDLLKLGVTETRQPRFDSMIAGYVLQSGRANYALRDLVQGYLEVTPPTSSAEMAAALSLLEPAMRERLGKEGQTPVLDDIELPLVPLLAEMEHNGIAVNPDALRDFSKQLETEIARTAQSIYEQAGREFNIGSPKQLGDVLFEEMEIPGQKKTKTGYATGAEVLQLLAPSHPICADIMTYREITKLKSTYADSLPKMVGKDGRIHTTYAQTVAATGRLSSNDPNLQNIPNRTELGRNIRRAFIPANGYCFASFDYSQIELRVLAHMCGDVNLLNAFEEDKDVHRTTAALMWNVPEAEVTKQQRGFAKTLNFAVLYGVTNYGLANQLGGGFSISEAQALIDQYRERFPKVKAFTDSVIAEARSKGFTTTLAGRRRYFPDIHNANRNERMYAERQAMNAPIQGTASDMIKMAMIKVGHRLARGDSKARMLLQVHDELLFELPDEEDVMLEPIRQDMEQAMTLSVPVKVDLKMGSNWDQMEESRLVAAGS